MTREKSCTPVASYAQLKLAETAVNNAVTASHVRKAAKQYGAKVDYKTFRWPEKGGKCEASDDPRT